MMSNNSAKIRDKIRKGYVKDESSSLRNFRCVILSTNNLFNPIYINTSQRRIYNNFRPTFVDSSRNYKFCQNW